MVGNQVNNHATLWSNLQDCKISSRAEIPKLDPSVATTKQSCLQISSNRASIRVNLPKGMESSYLSRAKVKITNLSLTVVIIFIITNLPYMVDEFIRQGILASSWCTMSWCGAVEVTTLIIFSC